jgi:hypothetical protein
MDEKARMTVARTATGRTTGTTGSGCSGGVCHGGTFLPPVANWSNKYRLPPWLLKVIVEAMGAQWLTDFNMALAQANASKSRILLALTGDTWCSHCMALKNEVFLDPEFAWWVYEEGLILCDIDYPADPTQWTAAQNQLYSQYDGQGFPTVLCLESDGTVRGQPDVGYASGTGEAQWTETFEQLANLPPVPS